jgi:hypothetical protein
VSRQLEQAARAFADSNKARITAIPTDRDFFADVQTVTAGAGPGGNALVTVSYRGTTLTAASYNAAYTPVVGDRVLCGLIADQLIVKGRYIN